MIYFFAIRSKIQLCACYNNSRLNGIFIIFHFSIWTLQTTVGIIKLRLFSGDGAVEERMWLHQRRAGKGIVEEKEATRWEHQAITGCDKQNDVDYGGNAWLRDEVSILSVSILWQKECYEIFVGVKGRDEGLKWSFYWIPIIFYGKICFKSSFEANDADSRSRLLITRLIKVL